MKLQQTYDTQPKILGNYTKKEENIIRLDLDETNQKRDQIRRESFKESAAILHSDQAITKEEMVNRQTSASQFENELLNSGNDAF